MRKLYLLFIFLTVSYYAHAQKENNIVDLMIECYEDYFDLNKREEPKPLLQPTTCPAIPKDFYDFFNTKVIDFASLREGNVKTFSFSDSLCSPLKQQLKITSNYGMREYEKHYGVDFRLNVGDTVYSVFCGKVRVIQKSDEGYGNVVVMRHYNMSETVYAHLSKILVTLDQELKVGDPLGLGGSSGHSTGPHLHFELRYKGYPINPIVDNKFLKHFPVYSP